MGKPHCAFVNTRVNVYFTSHKTSTVELVQMVDSPFWRLIQKDRSILLLSSSSWHFPHCVFKRLQLNHFPSRHINSSGLSCFSGADTGGENKGRKKSGGLIVAVAGFCRAWSQVCRSQNTLDFPLLMAFDLCLSHHEQEAFSGNGVMDSLPARSCRNTRKEVIMEHCFCWE